MNRETILTSIRRQLRESEVREQFARPLGEIVAMVARDLRTANPRTSASRSVTPIAWIADFVEGNASPDVVVQVCSAAMTDNSVLAEIISAVRANESKLHLLPPLDPALVRRIIDLGPRAPAHLPSTIRIDQNKKRGYRWQIAITIGCAAASLLMFVAVGYFVLQRSSADLTNIATDHARKTSAETALDRDPTETQNEPLVTNPESIAQNTIPAPEATSTPERQLNVENPPSPAVAIVPENTPSLPSVIPPQPTKPVTQLTDLQWSRIHGLLAMQSLENAESTPSEYVRWKTPAKGERLFAADHPDQQQLRLATLPLSRAQATLKSGGDLVLASDTGVLLDHSEPSVSLSVTHLHGSLALMEMPGGTVIRLRLNELPQRSHLDLRWSAPASIVIAYSSLGVTVQIRDEASALQISPVEVVGLAEPVPFQIKTERVDRLPPWVDRPIHSLSLPRNVLAQFSESTNLTTTIRQSVEAIAALPAPSSADSKRLMLLAGWLAALEDTKLYRLANHAVPVLRQAALRRLVELPEWEPRYREIWADAERSVRDPQQIQRLKMLCGTVRRGGPPTTEQIDLGLQGLESPDIAGRALSDYLLRLMYQGSGPRYDPTWTGATQRRAINVWRQFTGRSANPAQGVLP